MSLGSSETHGIAWRSFSQLFNLLFQGSVNYTCNAMAANYCKCHSLSSLSSLALLTSGHDCSVAVGRKEEHGASVGGQQRRTEHRVRLVKEEFQRPARDLADKTSDSVAQTGGTRERQGLLILRRSHLIQVALLEALTRQEGRIYKRYSGI